MLNAWTIVSGVILASVQLVNDSAFDVDSFVSDRIGEAIGRKLAVESWSGTGSSALLGIQTAINARGVQTGQKGGVVQLGAGTDVPIFGNYSSPSTTELAGNVLSPMSILKTIQALDPIYLGSSKFYMNPVLAWNMASVTDGNGRPLVSFLNGFNVDNVLDPNYNSASPIGRMFGFPIILDSAIPVLTANTVSGLIFGDLNRAMVLRVVRGDARIDTQNPTVGGVSQLRLTERYADYLQIGYLGYLRADARSNDLRAVAGIKANAT